MPTAPSDETRPILPSSVAVTAPGERRRTPGAITLLVPVVLVLATLGVLIFGKREPKDALGLAKYWLGQ